MTSPIPEFWSEIFCNPNRNLNLPCQCTPAECLKFLLNLGLLESGQPALNMDRQWKQWLNSLQTAGMLWCSFFSNSFRGLSYNSASCPLFSFMILLILVPHVHPHTLKILLIFIPVYCSGSQETLNKVNCQSLLQALFLLLCQFNMKLNVLNSWLPLACWFGLYKALNQQSQKIKISKIAILWTGQE